jgi:DNA-binding transcriptional MerR regulator
VIFQLSKLGVMAERPRAYTIDELERLSGIDRRTIAYYVQEGLLPRIGRRGPRTRYPQLFLDRLLFIRQQREREEAGELDGTLTLAEIRELFEREDAATIAAAVRGEEREPRPYETPEAAREQEARYAADAMGPASGPSPDDQLSYARLEAPRARMASLEARMRRLMEKRTDAEATPEEDERMSLRHSAPPPPDERGTMGQQPVEDLIAEFLARLDEAAGRREWGPRGGSEHWTRAAITGNLTVSARNLDEDHAYLLERLARELRQLLERQRRR